MRVAFDVSPLSHPRAGVGNYILGALRGLVEAGADVVAFAPVSVRGKRQVEEALDGIDVERRLLVLPFAHAWRTTWSRLERPAAERWLGGFDVLHFSDWMYPPQRGGVRATTIHDLVPLRFPEWTHGRTVRMHGAKYRHAARTAHLFVCNSAYTARDVQELLHVDAERVRVAHPAPAPVFTSDGERAELDGPYALTVATLEPRKNLETLLDAHELLGGELALAVVGGERLGPAAASSTGRASSGSATWTTMSSRGSTAARRCSSIRRASRASAFRCSRRWPAACRSSRRRIRPSTRRAATRRCAPIPTAPRRSRRRSRMRGARRDELVRLGSAHAARFSTRAMGEAILAAYADAAARL